MLPTILSQVTTRWVVTAAWADGAVATAAPPATRAMANPVAIAFLLRPSRVTVIIGTPFGMYPARVAQDLAVVRSRYSDGSEFHKASPARRRESMPGRQPLPAAGGGWPCRPWLEVPEQEACAPGVVGSPARNPTWASSPPSLQSLIFNLTAK